MNATQLAGFSALAPSHDLEQQSIPSNLRSEMAEFQASTASGLTTDESTLTELGLAVGRLEDSVRSYGKENTGVAAVATESDQQLLTQAVQDQVQALESTLKNLLRSSENGSVPGSLHSLQHQLDLVHRDLSGEDVSPYHRASKLHHFDPAGFRDALSDLATETEKLSQFYDTCQTSFSDLFNQSVGDDGAAYELKHGIDRVAGALYLVRKMIDKGLA